MDFLQTVLNFLGSNGESVKNLLQLLSENSFDLHKILGKLTPESIGEILSETIKSRSQNAENGTEDFSFDSVGLTPIANIADKEVVFALNRYLSDSI